MSAVTEQVTPTAGVAAVAAKRAAEAFVRSLLGPPGLTRAHARARDFLQ